ncbi:hypothetical protein HFO65_15880 [Rhizobium laguerreae]|uniref:hypothetical protein n=1 Tax=Rhizobium laguerreae TaxID=1076926 RepID=UPI001C8FC536|nr:hypothetical protein [Rhizobium laguerreae]MBY3162114.1 hypothetical protein [Rhizobium laguerreae]
MPPAFPCWCSRNISSLNVFVFVSIASISLCHRYQGGCEFAALVVGVQSTGLDRAYFRDDGLQGGKQKLAFMRAGDAPDGGLNIIVEELYFHRLKPC